MPVLLLSLLAIGLIALKRAQALGAVLLLAAPVLYAWLIFGRGLPPDLQQLVEIFGLHALTFVLALGLAGMILRFQRPALLYADRRIWACSLLAVLTTAGLLSLARPEWRLGQTSLSEISAGGQLGTFVTGSLLGVVAWMIASAALIRLASPEFVDSLVQRALEAVVRVRGWRGYRLLIDRVQSARPGVVCVVAPSDLAPVQAVVRWAREGEEHRPVNPRLEMLGLALIVLATGLSVLLLTASTVPQPLSGVVALFGFHAFTLVLVMAVAGTGLWARKPGVRQAWAQPPRWLPLSLVSSAAMLGIARPAWHVGQVSFDRVSAGGELGQFLTGSTAGISVCVAVVLVLVAVAWPYQVRAVLTFAAYLLAELRSAIVTLVRLFLPVAPAPDERLESGRIVRPWFLGDEDEDGLTSDGIPPRFRAPERSAVQRFGPER
jgi:hypothetical protein